MQSNDKFEKAIENLKQEGRYRVFNDILRVRGDFPQAIWYSKYAIKKIINGVLMIIWVWVNISLF